MSFVALDHRPVAPSQGDLIRILAVNEPCIQLAYYFAIGGNCTVLSATADHRIEIFPVRTPEHPFSLSSQHYHLTVSCQVPGLNKVSNYLVQDLWCYIVKHRRRKNCCSQLFTTHPGMVMHIQENLLEQDVERFFGGDEVFNFFFNCTFDDRKTAEQLAGVLKYPCHKRRFAPSATSSHTLKK